MFPPDLATFLNDFYRQKGVDVLPGQRASGLETRDGQTVLKVENAQGAGGRELVCDGMVAGIGIVPNAELARAAGLEVDDGIRVDRSLRTILPVNRQGRRQLRPDEAAADHGEALAIGRQFPQALVIVEGAVVEDPVAPEGQAPRRPAGRQEQLAVAPDVSPVVGDAPVPHVQVPGRPPQAQVDPELLGVAPDVVRRLVFPQPLVSGGRS
jgi:hypothetical protein